MGKKFIVVDVVFFTLLSHSSKVLSEDGLDWQSMSFYEVSTQFLNKYVLFSTSCCCCC